MAKQSQNRFLGALCIEDQNLLAPLLEPVELRCRERLDVIGRASAHMYFIEAGLASVMGFSKGRCAQAEVSLIGREGMVGMTALVGLGQSVTEATMLSDGKALRISGADLRGVASDSSSLQAAFLRYVHCMWLQAASSALANAQGTIAQRLARWILMASDRVQDKELRVTHQSIAFSLGVRRASVTLVIDEFEKRRFIAVGRGQIAVLDREGLVEVSGGFYGASEADYENFLNAEPADADRSWSPEKALSF